MSFMVEVEVACTDVARRICSYQNIKYWMTLCNADIQIYPLHLNDRRCCRIYHASTMCATCVRSSVNASLEPQNVHHILPCVQRQRAVDLQ